MFYRVYLRSPILQTGLILVDLPGGSSLKVIEGLLVNLEKAFET